MILSEKRRGCGYKNQLDIVHLKNALVPNCAVRTRGKFSGNFGLANCLLHVSRYLVILEIAEILITISEIQSMLIFCGNLSNINHN